MLLWEQQTFKKFRDYEPTPHQHKDSIQNNFNEATVAGVEYQSSSTDNTATLEIATQVVETIKVDSDSSVKATVMQANLTAEASI